MPWDPVGACGIPWCSGQEEAGPILRARPTLLVFLHQESNTLVPEFLCGRHWLGLGPTKGGAGREQSGPGVLPAWEEGTGPFHGAGLLG